MKCKACDQILSDIEAGRKDRDTEVFLDLCGRCLTTSNEAGYNYAVSVETDIDETKGDSPWLRQG